MGVGLLGLTGVGDDDGEVEGLVLDRNGVGDKHGDFEVASCGKSFARPKSATTTVFPSLKGKMSTIESTSNLNSNYGVNS